MKKQIICLSRGTTYYNTRLVFNNGSEELIEQEIMTVLNEYLHCYGMSLAVSKQLCSEVFTYIRLAPIIISVKKDRYFALTGKLTDDDIILYDIDWVYEEHFVGAKAHLRLSNRASEIICNKTLYLRQKERIQSIRRFYDSSDELTTEFYERILKE